MFADPQMIANILKKPQYVELLKKANGYKEIDSNLLELCSEAIHAVELSFGDKWNLLNKQRNGEVRPGDTIISGPSFPPHPQPFSSWSEFRMTVFGALNGFPYESHVVDVWIKKRHVSDWVDINNNRIWYQGKGAIRNADQARELILAAEQNCLHQVFIFTVPNINCVWSKPRKDGKIMTQEDWAEKQGFDYTYETEVRDWLQSERHHELVENFGRHLPQLENRTTRTLQEVLFNNPALFAHKQQSAHVTMTVQ